MSSSGKLYVIGTDWRSPLKIGVARNPAHRVERLQVASPLALRVLWQSDDLPDPFAVETAMHSLYDEHRVRGEWFAIPGIDPDLFAAAVAGAAIAARRPRPQEDTSKAAAAAVAFLITRELRRGLSTQDAIGAVADHCGLGRSAIWALRYRTPVDIYVSAYVRIASVLWKSLGRPQFAIEELPTPKDIEAALIAETETVLGSAARKETTD
jgi:hypothetical protein